MRTLKDIKALYDTKQPKEKDKTTQTPGLEIKSADEKRFADKHVIQKIADRNGNGDDVFNATNIKGVERTPKHGYNPGEDEKVYEELEITEEDLLEYEQHIYRNRSGKLMSRDDEGNEKQYIPSSRRSNPSPLKLTPDDKTPHVVHVNGEKLGTFAKMDALNIVKLSRGKATAHPVEEEIEHIDEISKSTLGSYIKKASHDVARKSDFARKFAMDSEKQRNDHNYFGARKSMERADKTFEKSWKRREGIAKAADLLAKEDVESIDEKAKWRSTPVAQKVTDPEDWASSHSYDYHHDNPRSTGMLKATSDTPEKYSSLSARRRSQVATQGPRKGMITKRSAESLKNKIKANLRGEEVELDEGDVIHFPGKMKAEKEKPDTAPGWMLRKSPELAQKLKDAQDRVKKRKEIKEASKASMDPEKKAKSAIDTILKNHEEPPGEKGMKIGEEKDDVPFEGPYTKASKKQPGQKSDPGYSAARHLARQAMQKMLDKKEKMKEEVEIDEVLKPSMGAGAYISDFVHSKNPKFAGKSKKERMKQALAAYYAAKRGE